MAAITVRNLDDDVRNRLRVRAAQHGRSMEAEVRAILSEAVESSDEQQDWLSALRAAALSVGGVDLDVPQRVSTSRVPDFSDR